MSITPGSLDYLYYNDVLDHIPYEAYEMGPIVTNSQQTGLKGFPALGSLKQSVIGGNNYNSVTNQNTNTSDYLNSAMKGEMYGYYGSSNDSFTRSTNSVINQSGNYSQSAQMFGASYGYGGLNGSMNGMGSMNNYGYMSSAQGMYGYDSAVQGEDYPKYSLYNTRGYGNRQANYTSANGRKSGFGDALLKMLAIAGTVVGSIFLITKLKGKPAQSTTIWQDLKNWFNNSKFWPKLNPKNWAPKLWNKINPKNWAPSLWTKINPKNWAPKLWSKINPKNIFKKKTSTQANNKKSFWSKLKFKNWFKKKGGNGPATPP